MLISTTGAPATASALQRLQQAYDGDRQPGRWGALVGASILTTKAAAAYDHVLAMQRMERVLRPLVKRGWLILPSLRFEGYENDEIDFFVLSPLGSVYTMLVQRYANGRMRANLSEIRGRGFRDSLPQAIRDRSQRVESLLKDALVPYVSLTPTVVLVDVERLRAVKSRVSLAVADWQLVRELLAREERRRSFGEEAAIQDWRLLTPEFWQERVAFDPDAYKSNLVLFAQLRRLLGISAVVRRVGLSVLAALGAGVTAYIYLQMATTHQLLIH